MRRISYDDDDDDDDDDDEFSCCHMRNNNSKLVFARADEKKYSFLRGQNKIH